jgi:hypothetical protein
MEVSMRPLGALVAVCLVLVPGGPAHGQDSARAIIEKAIEAQGGEKQVAKLRIMGIKVEGRAHDQVRGQTPIVTEDTWQLPEQYKSVRRFQVEKDATFEAILVIDGDKGWRMINGKITDLSKERVADIRKGQQQHHLHPLLYVNDQGRELAVLEEIKIAGKPAVGVLVKTEGQSDVKLYFDKSSGLLVKSERNFGRPGLENLTEVYYSDYQEKDGLKHYRRISGFVNGELAQEGTVTELEFFTKLDPKVFAKP